MSWRRLGKTWTFLASLSVSRFDAWPPFILSLLGHCRGHGRPQLLEVRSVMLSQSATLQKLCECSVVKSQFELLNCLVKMVDRKLFLFGLVLLLLVVVSDLLLFVFFAGRFWLFVLFLYFDHSYSSSHFSPTVTQR